jgi:dienelactone hydrolase
MEDAYGRNTQQQLGNPAYMTALQTEHNEVWLQQLAQQAATPTRLAITPGNVFRGWNGGNPLRRGWTGGAGCACPSPTRTATAPSSAGTCSRRCPARATRKPDAAQDLAERGYVVLTYDVQGQGTSETFPHENDQVSAVPFCNPFAEPARGEDFGCPGVPAQQDSNFVYGTRDALSFFLSTPRRPYRNRNAGDTQVSSFNPLWRQFDRSRDRRTATPGRTRRIAIVGHSLGASAVSYVQGVDRRVETVVALDKLHGDGASGIPGPQGVKPVVPALAVQSEYGFNVQPYWMQHGSSIQGKPGPPTEAPDPRREAKTGFDSWKGAGVDSMLVVPRASTHLEYTDIALVLPASRYGQALTSVYVQRWLGRYLKHRRSRLLAPSFRYLEPVDVGKWEPIQLDRSQLLSFYFCSAYAFGGRSGPDIAGLGGCG